MGDAKEQSVYECGGEGGERGGAVVHQQYWEWNPPRTQIANRAISGARPALINGPNQGCSGDHLCPTQVRTIRPTLECPDRRRRHSSHPNNEDNKRTIMAYL